MATDLFDLKAAIEEWALRVWEDAAQCLFDQLEAARATHSSNDWGGRVDPPTVGDSISGAITYDAPQAEWTDTGTRPHVIQPISAKALVFEGDGGLVFAMHVNHPGYAGSRWFQDTVTDAGWEACLEQAAGSVSVSA